MDVKGSSLCVISVSRAKMYLSSGYPGQCLLSGVGVKGSSVCAISVSRAVVSVIRVSRVVLCLSGCLGQ